MGKRAFWELGGILILSSLRCTPSSERTIELQGGTELTYELDLSHVAVDRVQVTRETKEVIAKRLEAYGLRRVGIAIQGEDRLVIRLPRKDARSFQEMKTVIERAGNLDFQIVAEDQSPALVEQYEKEWQSFISVDRAWVEKKRGNPSFSERRPQPPRYIVRSEVEKVTEGGRGRFAPKPNGKRVLENFHPAYDEKTQSWIPEGIVNGRYLDRVVPQIDQNFHPAIGFHFTGEGAAQFSELTRINKGRRLAIVLDDDIVQIATIREQITSSGQLSGDFTDDDVKAIVSILRGGSLKARPTLISEKAIEPAK